MANPSTQLSLFEQTLVRSPGLSEEEVVRRICERVLAEAGAEPAVPVRRVASVRGVVSITEAEQPWAGTLVPGPDGLAVTVRQGDGGRRQRFTVCHEAAHTFFPGFRDASQYRCDGARDRTEKLCDMAASELLFPRQHFVGDLLDADFGLSEVEELSDNYQGSIEATANRFVDLWPEDAMLMVLRRRHKPAERGREEECEARLRLDYALGSGTWPFTRQHKSVGQESALVAAENGEVIAGVVTDLSGLVAADSCPVEIHAGRYGANGRVLALARPVRTRGR